MNTTTFANTPIQGVLRDNSMVGYWNMDEGNGSIAHDSSGSNNTGYINGTTWVSGKFNDALAFDGTSSYVNCGHIVPPSNAITVVAWLKSSSLQDQTLFGLDSGHRFLYISNGTNINYWWKTSDSEAFRQIKLPSSYIDQAFHMVVFTYNSETGYAQTFWDNQLIDSSFFGGGLLPSADNYNTSIGARFGGTDKFMNGTIDDFRIFSRALTAQEISSFYLMGPYAQPNQFAFADYYNFTDSTTNNTLLIHVEGSDTNSGNTSLITCTNFFVGNNLIFKGNNTAVLNLWTNLGCPTFTTGVWNSQNCTTTLLLNASSTAELNWNPEVPPSPSRVLTTLTTVGINTTFFTLWTDNRSLSSGGYIFSTNNTGQWINASWTPFNQNPNWGNASLTLNCNVGAVVGFREYANNSLNLWGDSGIYAITTTAIVSAPSPTPSSLTTPTPSSNPTPTSSSNATNPSSTSTPDPTLTSPPKITQTDSFLIESILIDVIAVVALVAGFAFAFKKGYITVEVVDEEKTQEIGDDYTI